MRRHLAPRVGIELLVQIGTNQVGGFTRADVRRMQLAFEAEGHDVGGADGLVGFKTRIAVGQWQAKAGEKVTCFPDKEMVRSFR